jgi:hypothetical protein
MQHTLTLDPICQRGHVTRMTLESSANGPVTVTLGKNTAVPVLRIEGQFSRQRADWQMSDGHGSDYDTIRCGSQVALISWTNGRFLKRSGDLPLTIQDARTSAQSNRHQEYCFA